MIRTNSAILAVLLVIASAPPCDATAGEAVNQRAQDMAASPENQSAGSEEPNDEPSAILDFIEKQKELTETQGHRAAQWVDSFFGDPAYESEVASSQFRLRPELYYRKEQGLKLKLKASFKFRLPNIERKVSLFGGSSDYDDSFEEAVDDDVSEPAIGLQFFGKEREKWGTSLSVGLKFNEFAGFIGPRFRYRTNWTERTSFRFVQKILWQTNNEWQSRSRFDLNFAVNDRLFFRQMVDGRWRGEYSDEEGFRTRVSSFLTRGLPNAAGLQAEATTIFHTRPDTHVDQYVAALRYRKRALWDWFYYEIVPQLAWEKEFDYKLNPGIRLRVEIFYGADKDTRFWKREAEDTEEFRW